MTRSTFQKNQMIKRNTKCNLFLPHWADLASHVDFHNQKSFKELHS